MAVPLPLSVNYSSIVMTRLEAMPSRRSPVGEFVTRIFEITQYPAPKHAISQSGVILYHRHPYRSGIVRLFEVNYKNLRVSSQPRNDNNTA